MSRGGRASLGFLLGAGLGLALGRLTADPLAAGQVALWPTLIRLGLAGSGAFLGAAAALWTEPAFPEPAGSESGLGAFWILAWLVFATLHLDFFRSGWADANAFFKYEGVNAALVQRVLDGQSLYRQARFPYGTLMYQLPALWLRLTGPSLIALRVYAFCLHAAGLWAAGLWLRRLVRQGPAFAVSLFLLPFLFYPVPFNAEPHQSCSRVLLGLGLLYAAARAGDRAWSSAAAGAGALAGLFFFYSPDFSVACAACAWLFLVPGRRTAYAAGAALAAGLGFAIVALQGGLQGLLWPWSGAARHVLAGMYAAPYPDLWRDTFALRLSGAALKAWAVSWASYWQVFVCAAAAAVLIGRLRFGVWGSWEAGLAAVAFYRLLLLPRSAQISGYAMVGDYLHLAPAFIAAAALAGRALQDPRGRGWSRAWAACLALGSLIYLKAFWSARPWSLPASHPLLAAFHEPPGEALETPRARGVRLPADWRRTVDETAAYLAARPGSVYNFVDQPMWYFLLGRSNPTPFELLQWSAGPEERALLLRSLRGRPPDWVIDDSEATFPGGSSNPAWRPGEWEAFRVLLDRGYEPAAAFGPIRILKRRSAA